MVARRVRKLEGAHRLLPQPRQPEQLRSTREHANAFGVALHFEAHEISFLDSLGKGWNNFFTKTV